MSLFTLKSTHKPVKEYFAALATFQKHGHTTEGNTRFAFADLLKRCASPYGWHLVEEYRFKGTGKQSLRADGALVDDLTLQHGIWEAKDNDDDLEKEIKAKRAKGYPLTNILFQSPSRAILYQGRFTVVFVAISLTRRRCCQVPHTKLDSEPLTLATASI